MTKKAVVLHSGGLDSTVLLYYMQTLYQEVLPISISYGQRHIRELQAAIEVWSSCEVKGEMVDLRSLQTILKGSSQTDGDIDVPEGHYAEDNMRVTVVPNRNMILISVATAYAISSQAEVVAYAAHAGDHAQYPDCREVFIAALENTIRLCDYNPPVLYAPFAGRTKADIVKLGSELRVPFDLTWSCYKGGEGHCGRCGTCVERAEAFHLAKVFDPTKYQDAYYWQDVIASKNG